MSIQDLPRATEVGIWEHFTMKDGLPDMKIECIYADRQGILWIGTHSGGVVRYDGSSFQTFKRRDGLAGNGVFSVIEDREGNLWFGTDQGLSRYDGKKFETFNPGETYCFLWGSCMDVEGNLWFGLEGKIGRPPAVCKWNGKELDLVHVGDPIEGQGLSIKQVVIDKDGDIWCGGNGLYCTNINKYNHQSHDPISPLSKIISLFIDSNGMLFISTHVGIYIINKDSIEILDQEFLGLKISDVTEDNNSVCWITTYDGLLLSYSHNYGLYFVDRLNVNFWCGLCFDGIGRLWVSTYGMGLYCYNSKYISKLQVNYVGNIINCLDGDNDGKLWIGTDNGLYYYDNNMVNEIIDENLLEGVTALFIDINNRLYIGTRNSQLFFYDNNELIRCSFDNRFLGVRISHIVGDCQNRIWFTGFQYSGFGFYKDEEGVVYFYNRHGSRYPTYIGAIAVDHKGCIWFGSSAPADWDGLCKYEDDVYNYELSLPGRAVLSLLEISDGCMCIGTNEGILFYNGEITNSITQKDGLSCEIITVLTKDKEGILWIGTDGGGVCCYDGNVVQNIQIPEDPKYNVINDIYVDKSGQYWFATRGGLVKYTKHSAKPVVVIEQVVTTVRYDEPVALTVPNTEDHIRFCFVGSSSIASSSTLIYRYCMEGLEEHWNQTRNTEVEYNNLAKGKYIFKVQAVDRDHNYSEIAQVKLIVTEEPWLRVLKEFVNNNGENRTRSNEAGGKILLVDDQIEFVAICGDLLNRSGYTVEICKGISDTKKSLQENEFDLVLLNIRLQERSSLEVLRMAKQQRDGPEVIVLADFDYLKDAVETTRLGAYSYLTKPFEAEHLLGQIQQALTIRRDPILVYIRAHISEIGSREEVAQLFRVSPNTVSNRVKKVTGLTFIQFVHTCRIEEAQKLLAGTELNIQQIALRLGFASHETFTRTFSRRTGRPPLEYRREMRSTFF